MEERGEVIVNCRKPEARSLSENRHCGVYAYLVKIGELLKNKHSHIFDIAGIIIDNSKEFGQVNEVRNSERAFSDSLLGICRSTGTGFSGLAGRSRRD